MDTLAGLAKHFFLRDATYIIGGALVGLSVLFTTEDFDLVWKIRDAPLFWPLLAGMAWALGYAVSDGLGGLRIFPIFPPSHLVTRSHGFGFPGWLYRRFADVEAVPWAEIQAHLAALPGRSDWLLSRPFGNYHRTVVLRHLGAVVGECGLIASGLVLLACLHLRWDWPPLIPVCRDFWALAAFGVATSILLLAIGWVKAIQQTHMILRSLQAGPHTPEAT